MPCILMIQKRDTATGVPKVDVLKYRPGHVVGVFEMGHRFSAWERGFFDFVMVEDSSAVELKKYVEREYLRPGVDDPTTIKPIRRLKLDVSAIKGSPTARESSIPAVGVLTAVARADVEKCESISASVVGDMVIG